MIERAREILKTCNKVSDFTSLSQNDKQTLQSQFGKRRLKTENVFLGKSDTVRYKIFDLPQGYTCPGKTEICAKGCYQIAVEKMHKKEEKDSAILCYRKLNWFYSLQDDFVQKMIAELNALCPKKNQQIRVRIHASGDFYSPEYLKKWLLICLTMKLLGKGYIFVAYTKSFKMLDKLLSDQVSLQEIRKEAYNLVGIKYRKKVSLTLKDFNIHMIASVMDDTKDEDKAIIDKYQLAKYIVTDMEKNGLVDCKGISCAECSKCYREKMKDVKTGLR